jgi:hypothetical protein
MWPLSSLRVPLEIWSFYQYQKNLKFQTQLVLMLPHPWNPSRVWEVVGIVSILINIKKKLKFQAQLVWILSLPWYPSQVWEALGQVKFWSIKNNLSFNTTLLWDHFWIRKASMIIGISITKKTTQVSKSTNINTATPVEPLNGLRGLGNRWNFE